MKKILFFAAVILAFASCASDSFTGTDEAGRVAQGEKPISFGFDVPAATRAEGAAAAGKLNNQFIVWGEKGENDGAAPVTDGSTGHQLVFKNYVVNYTASTAYTTTSNTKDWEYVGLTQGYGTNVVPQAGETQTIKYWDYAATGYTFTAVSAKPDDISSGKVVINKVTSGTTVYDKGYTVTVTDEADLSSLYFADRVNIAKTATYDRTQPNQYGGNVKFTFRNGVSQVRVGMYETIPGYDVKVTKFYYAASHAGSTPAFSDMTSFDKAYFVADVPNVSPDVANSKTSVAGTFTVKYYPQSTENDAAGITNHPTISFTPTASADSKITLSLGAGVYDTKLNESSATPTFDQTAGAFTTVFPQEGNEINLKLKIDYQLSNTVTGETINIKGKTAEVPAKYLQWKPNFKYTYLFKINDNDLYPITFDAVVIEAENGQVEYITTVSEPSITTFGVVLDNSSAFKNYVTGKDEYQLPGGTDKLDIYTTFMRGSSVLTPQLTGAAKANYVKVYSVDYKAGATDAEKAEKPITELSVANAIEHTGGLITATDITSDATTYFTSIPAKVTTVTAEDGTSKTIDALKLTGVKTAGKYAVEIVTYEEVTGLTAGTSDVDAYYTLSSDTYSAASGKAVAETKYYKQIKTYKVITVQAAS